MGGPIVYHSNKYTIKSINSKDSIQAHHVDWVGEIYDSRKLWVWSANIIKVDIN